MRPGYDELMKPVIASIPALMIMIILVIPLTILGTRSARQIMKDQTAMLYSRKQPG